MFCWCRDKAKCVCPNGSPRSHPKKRPKSSKMLLNSSSPAALRCATFSNTKVHSNLCPVLTTLDSKVVYRRYLPSRTVPVVAYKRYASLFFITGIESDDNELITLEIVHRYVEVLDRYFGNV